ncbi:MAG: hypothetical protein RLZZ299_727 [Pseudomonadota bacterium]|jgi:hypothetical protein
MIDINKVEAYLRKHNPRAVVLPGYEAAIVGVTRTENGEVLVYDYEAMLAICVAQGMSRREAEDYGEEAILPFHDGHGTPVILRHLEGTHD